MSQIKTGKISISLQVVRLYLQKHRNFNQIHIQPIN